MVVGCELLKILHYNQNSTFVMTSNQSLTILTQPTLSVFIDTDIFLLDPTLLHLFDILLLSNT